jgi:hypothetical protein
MFTGTKYADKNGKHDEVKRPRRHHFSERCKQPYASRPPSDPSV